MIQIIGDSSGIVSKRLEDHSIELENSTYKYGGQKSQTDSRNKGGVHTASTGYKTTSNHGFSSVSKNYLSNNKIENHRNIYYNTKQLVDPNFQRSNTVLGFGTDRQPTSDCEIFRTTLYSSKITKAAYAPGIP